MTPGLFIRAAVKYFAGIAAVSAALFIPAGSLGYLNGWIFIGVLFVPMLAVGIIMMIISPDMLRKRLDGRENESGQKKIVVLGMLIFIAAFVSAGLSYRFGALMLPMAASAAAAVVFLAAYVLYAEVMRENVWLSRKIEVSEGQKVIDTGMYAVVRHPMYSVTVVLFLTAPLILGSLISFIIMLAYIPLIAARVRSEEEFLRKELKGYTEYTRKVKYRLFPLIW